MMSVRGDTKFNLIFWGSYFVYEWVAFASVGSEYYRYFINALAIVPITMIASFITVHILFRRFYLKDDKKRFWVFLIVTMILFILLRRAFNYYYTYPVYYPEGQLTMPYLFWPKLVIEGVNIYLIVGLYSMFYFVRAWYEQQRLTQELQQKKTEAELQMLRAQVQPHFIFNTLNNIYSYAIQKKERVPELIHRLSSFLSYNLYDNKSEFIELSKELEFIKSYIELEKLRYGDRLDVSVNVYGSIEGLIISPLLLLPLVENCFKHGFTSTLSHCWIRMDIYFQSKWLTIKIENSVGEYKMKDSGTNNGLGIKNVRKRLEIIYPDRHDFKIIEEKNSFMTIVKIKPDK